ncbi:hypothetical protein [Aquiflexum lacus]|uniref:hypothetical protein n=1 Tax=Aquiflexum lacus TaxID=2483805 RepID=UPI001893CEAD|nr:hypothetical protein [Aquiflexum lacus]
MKNFCYIILALLLITSCDPKEEVSLPMKVAKAYGFDNFDKINSIAYTWNVQANPETVRTRDWKWNIKERTVYYADADTSFTYSLDLTKEELPTIDGGFINDKYWLMFPFQLVWDTGYSYTILENVSAPISGQKTTQLTILYNQEDGYTPGDAYDLFLDENHMIKEWVFRRGNGLEGRPITWENEQDFKGVKFATEHKNEEGIKFIWFSNIQVD